MQQTKRTPAAKGKQGNGEISVSPNRLTSLLQTAIQKAVAEALQAPPEEAQDGARKEGVRGRKAPPKPLAEEGAQIAIFADDPFLEAVGVGTPEVAQPIDVDVPENKQPLLQTEITGEQPDPGLFDPTTPEFRFWNAASALALGVNFWGPLLPEGTQWTTQQIPLQVQLDEGVDFNAFFSRDSGLNFFHGVVDRVDPPLTVFSGESPHVLCHELGHAILDAVKPELFDTPSLEVAAFHEAFGDISSMLSVLQIPSLREFVLEQTEGKLERNSRLSQLARQLGWAIRVQIDPDAVDDDCLRNTSNSFFYRNPSTLPPSAPASQLSSEPHSFSRVFSGAFLDVLASMFRVGPAGATGNDSDKLEAITQDAGRLLVEGVRLAPAGPGFYAQVAAGMIQADQTLNGGRYRAALTSSFVGRGILSPSAAVLLARDLREHGGQAFGVVGTAARTRRVQFEGDNEGYKKTARDAPTLPVRPVTTGFGVTLHVHLAAEPPRFAVVAAGIGTPAGQTLGPEEEARSFIEDLIQLDRISHEGAPGVIPAELTSPDETSPSQKTHRLVKDDGRTVLKRDHFDCGFCRRRHRR
jgi:hypothetical protein